MILKTATVAFLLYILYRIVFVPAKSLNSSSSDATKPEGNIEDIDYEEME